MTGVSFFDFLPRHFLVIGFLSVCHQIITALRGTTNLLKNVVTDALRYFQVERITAVRSDQDVVRRVALVHNGGRRGRDVTWGVPPD